MPSSPHPGTATEGCGSWASLGRAALDLGVSPWGARRDPRPDDARHFPIPPREPFPFVFRLRARRGGGDPALGGGRGAPYRPRRVPWVGRGGRGPAGGGRNGHYDSNVLDLKQKLGQCSESVALKFRADGPNYPSDLGRFCSVPSPAPVLWRESRRGRGGVAAGWFSPVGVGSWKGRSKSREAAPPPPRGVERGSRRPEGTESGSRRERGHSAPALCSAHSTL